MEPIQRLQKWFQQTFFGLDEHPDDKNKKNKKEQDQTKLKESSPRRAVSQRVANTYAPSSGPDEPGPRITYQYAKSDRIHYPEKVKQEAKQLMENRKMNKPIDEDKKKMAETDSYKSYKSSSSEEMTKPKRVKFNNPDFKLTAIPSPIHGFRKVSPSQRTQLTLHEPEELKSSPVDSETDLWDAKEVKDHDDRNMDSLESERVELVQSEQINKFDDQGETVETQSDNMKAFYEPIEVQSRDQQEDVSVIHEPEVFADHLPSEKESPHEPDVQEVVLQDSEDQVVWVDDQEEKSLDISQLDDQEKESELELDQGDEVSLLEEDPSDLEVFEGSEVVIEDVTEAEHKSNQSSPSISNESNHEDTTRNVETIKDRKLKSDNYQSRPSSKSQDAEATSQHAQKPSVPFNVLMMPKDKQTSSTQMSKEKRGYTNPSIQLLKFPEVKQEKDPVWMEEQAVLLEETLQSFHVDAKVVNTTMGPSVTRFEIQPARGVKVNKVTNLSDDIKMALSAKEIRIEAPIPGKNTIGIEVPNLISEAVWLREILRRDVFIKPSSPMTVALGLDISGQPIVTDLRKMPHGLVAGATGSGKSVCINSILISLLYKATPDEVKLLLVDPKMVELAPYNDVPHLVAPVITDAKQATIALKWVVAEMEKRYEQFSQKGVRDVSRYNELYSVRPDKPAMPYILVVIDELADLMMVSPQEVEDSICRIAQKARACGIHLLVATQRPSVDVITGLIKANIPTRIAFSVSSQTDSRTILDMNGAERLLGRGDMLFSENGSPKPVRVQGTFVTDEEIEDVISYVKKQRKPEFLLDIEQMQKTVEHTEQEDDLFEEACYHVINQGAASASNLQRRFRIGYNRAARLIDMLEARGVITGAMGSKPRQVLVDELSIDQVLGYSQSE